MKIALCTELRNVEWFESRLRSLFEGDGQLVIDELWNEEAAISGTAAEPISCGCHRNDRGKGIGGCHSGKAAGTGSTACLVER